MMHHLKETESWLKKKRMWAKGEPREKVQQDPDNIVCLNERERKRKRTKEN